MGQTAGDEGKVGEGAQRWGTVHIVGARTCPKQTHLSVNSTWNFIGLTMQIPCRRESSSTLKDYFEIQPENV